MERRRRGQGLGQKHTLHKNTIPLRPVYAKQGRRGGDVPASAPFKFLPCGLAMPYRPYVLSVAGSDPSGGAGIQADVKTVADTGGEAGAVATALTVQTGSGVLAVHPIDPHIISKQLEAIFEDMPVRAVKIGMLCGSGVVAAVAPFVRQWSERGVPVTVDPICVSSSGFPLLDE